MKKAVLKDTKPHLWIVNVASCDANTDLVNLSGGERILLECLKHWQHMFQDIHVISDQSWAQKSFNYLEKKLDLNYHSFWVPKLFYNLLILLYPYKILIAFFKTFTYKIPKNTILFSTSDIFPDTISAFFIKLIYGKNVKWTAAFYFFAPNPFSSEFPYKGLWPKIRGLLYWFSQQICYKIILKYSSFIFICNDIDKDRIEKDGYDRNKLYSIYGGVDLSIPDKVPTQKKVYDAVYMARLHPQKGPMQAVMAWKEIVKTNKKARLAMIGNGPEENKIKKYIADHKLQKNIDLLGFMDGIEKYKILKSAKIFLHPPIYDTGGMAAAEGMAAGLPVVSFNIPGYHYIYPKGLYMASPIGDTHALAQAITKIISNPILYKKVQKEALSLIQSWGWDKRASAMYNHMINS